MRFQLISILFFVLSWVTAIPVEEDPLHQAQVMVAQYVEENFNEEETEAYHELIAAFSPSQTKIKREQYQELISSALVYINETGILWTLLDAVALNETRVQSLTQLLGSFLQGREFVIDVGSLVTRFLGGEGTQSNQTSAILQALTQSGLVNSMLDGLLLDEQLRPVIVELTYNVVLSQRDAIKALVDSLRQQQQQQQQQAKREDGDETITAEPFVEAEEAAPVEQAQEQQQQQQEQQQQETNSDGSLTEFLNNVISEVLASPFFQEVVVDTFNSLNDTGIAVYVTKRFLSTPEYLSLVSAITQTVIQSGAIKIDFSTISLQAILQQFLQNTDQLTALLNGLLSGETSGLSGIFDSFGKYSGAVQAIVAGLEEKGLFYQLNEYIFGDQAQQGSSNASVVEQTDATDDSQNKDQANAGVSLSVSGPIALLAAAVFFV